MYNPEKIYHALIDTGQDYADKRAAYAVLDDLTKSVLAKAYNSFSEGSAADRKEKALGHKDYLDHLLKLGVARHDFLLSQVKYYSTQALADAKRTEQSTKRTEMQNISGQT